MKNRTRTAKKNRPATQTKPSLADRSMQVERLEPRWTLSGLGIVESAFAAVVVVDSDQSLVVDTAAYQPGTVNQWLSQNGNSQPTYSETSERGVADTGEQADSTTATDSETAQRAYFGPAGMRMPAWAEGSEFFPVAVRPYQPAGIETARQDFLALVTAETNFAPHGLFFSAMGNWLWRPFDMSARWGNPAFPPGPVPVAGILSASGLSATTQPTTTLLVSNTDAAVLVAAPMSLAIGASSDMAVVETPSDPFRVEIPIVKDEAPYATRTATVPELDFSQELGGESGVSSDMAQIERTSYPAVAEAAAPGDTTFLDIGAPDSAVQKSGKPAVADAGLVVSREEIALDHVMAQAYAFALNASEGIPAAAMVPPEALPAETGSLPQRSSENAPATEGDRRASTSEPRQATSREPHQAGVDALSILAVAGAQVLMRKRKTERRQNDQRNLRAE